MRTKYTISYFIKKFSAIPRNQWTTGTFGYGEQHCALGHCGQRVGHSTPESDGLKKIFAQRDIGVLNTNDYASGGFKQKTPRDRILAALRSFRKSPRRTTVVEHG